MKNIIFILSMVVVTALPRISYALEVGDKAPVFETISTHGTVMLSEFEGNKHVILALYYADFTPV